MHLTRVLKQHVNMHVWLVIEHNACYSTFVQLCYRIGAETEHNNIEHNI